MKVVAVRPDITVAIRDLCELASSVSECAIIALHGLFWPCLSRMCNLFVVIYIVFSCFRCFIQRMSHVFRLVEMLVFAYRNL